MTVASTAISRDVTYKVHHRKVGPKRLKLSAAMSDNVNSDQSASVVTANKPKFIPELQSDFGTSAVSLPPLSEYRRPTFVYYALEFLANGYPGRLTERGLIAHPIYGAYIINDYLLQFDRSKDPGFIEAAVRVAEQTILLAEHVSEYDALMLYYTEEDALTLYPGKFISGLTQARYLVPMARLYEHTKDERFSTAARQFMNSLKVPQSAGGVLVDTPYGRVVEEYPHEIPTFVLNGWTTIIDELFKYFGVCGSQEAFDFAVENTKTLENVIRLYDFPQQMISRYQLTGFMYQKYVFGKAQNANIVDFETFVAGEWRSKSDDETNRWGNFVLPKGRRADGFAEHRQLMTNGVFSRIEPVQKLRVTIDVIEDDTVEFHLANGPYEPLISSMPTRRWLKLCSVPLKRGQNTVEFEVHQDNFDQLGYPTNFAKKLAGTHYNVYHWIHIKNFERISKYYQSELFAQTEAKWRNYVHWWPTFPELDGDEYSFDDYYAYAQKIEA